MSRLRHAEADVDRCVGDINRDSAKSADRQDFMMTACRDLEGLKILLRS